MSGITPLIDTLLHQVLGKRVDLLRSLPTNPPVKAPVAIESARPLSDDAQLDMSTSTTTSQGISRNSTINTAIPSMPMNAELNLASARTRFSETAQLISDALLNTEGESPVISTTKPILGDKPVFPISTQQVAQKLQQSVGQSGLFYESHVARWYKGEVPLKTVLDEARLRGFLPPTDGNNSPAVQADKKQDTAIPVAKTAAAAQSIKIDENDNSAPQITKEAVGVKDSNPTHILRQQLELLNNSSLRWEGPIWPDLSIALQIKLYRDDEQQKGKDANQNGDNSQHNTKEWEFQCTVHSSNKSKLDIHARGDSNTLWLTLGSCSKAVLMLLERDRVKLTQRLKEYGFTKVELRGQWVPRHVEAE